MRISMKATATTYPVISFDIALNKLKSHSMATADLSDLISELGSNCPAYFHHKFGGGLRLQQVPRELSELSVYLLQRFAGKKIRYLEVGIGSCGTLIFLDYLFRKNGISFIPSAIDDFSYTSAGHLSDQRARVQWCEENLGLKFLEYDSSQQAVATWLGDNRYDLILIDADHSFEGCLVDFLTYLPHLDHTGVLLFHDIRSSACPGVGEVYEFAKESFVTSRVFSESNTCGIGLLDAWNGDLPSAVEVSRVTQKHIRSLHQISKKEIADIRDQGYGISVKRLAWRRLKQRIKQALGFHNFI